VFNKPVDLGWFIETVKPGAFSRSIQEQDDVRALWNHDANHVLGRTKANTLSLAEDSVGLLVEVDPPDTQMARDLLTSIGRGDVTQMSFGFYARAVTIRREGELYYRDLTDCQLFDVSPVTFPAYEDTDIAVRSWLPSRQEIETLFRQSGPEETRPDDSWQHELVRMRLLLELEEAR